jgi:hypothetical protein
VRTTTADEPFLPGDLSAPQVFINKAGITDTLVFEKRYARPSNFDFFIDKKLGHTDERKRPYYESYSTVTSLEKTIRRANAKQPWMKYGPLIFTFFKTHDDQVVHLYYNVDGRWNGTIPLDSIAPTTLDLGQHSFKDVIVIINNAVDHLFNVDRIYWSLQHGLLRLDEKDGGCWTRLMPSR